MEQCTRGCAHREDDREDDLDDVAAGYEGQQERGKR
jgi:hypothetical protein